MTQAPPDWGNAPPPTPKKRHRLRTVLLIVGALIALIIAISVGSSGGGDPAPPKPAPAAAEGGGSADKEQREGPKDAAAAEKDERADMTSFKLDDRSQYGFTDIYVTWKITNDSSKTSDYVWDWEAVDSSGTRVENSTEFEENVKPGQTVTGEMPTLIEDPSVKLHVTEFDRTESY